MESFDSEEYIGNYTDYEFISFKLWIEENAKKPVNRIPVTLPVYFEELWQGVTAMNGIGSIIYK